MAQNKYNIHGMLVTSNEDDHKKRRERIEGKLVEAMQVVESIKGAMASEVLHANAMKVAAATWLHECDKHEYARNKMIEVYLKQIERCRGEILKLQQSIANTEGFLEPLFTTEMDKDSSNRAAAEAAHHEADEAAAIVDRKYGKKLRAAENEAERYRLKLVRIGLRGETVEKAETATETAEVTS